MDRVAAAADWWATFFEGPALEVWRRGHTPAENRAEAEAVARMLRLDPGAKVLDVPCGNGRLALELAAAGHAVRALDACAELLEEGRRAAEERGLALAFAPGDMRALAYEGEFDAVICAGNSFGYFDGAGNRAFLAGVARALRPGGRFLLEYPMVAELVDAHPPGRNWRILGDRLLLMDSCFDEPAGRVETSYTFVDLARERGDVEERTASYQVYGARELEQLLAGVGLVESERLGDRDERPFGPDSEQFYLRAVRR